MNQPTPAIVAQNAVRRLPRVALLLLCVAYLMPGMLGRGPWKSADVAAFGYMQALAQHAGDWERWFDPLLLGLKPEIPALLPYWIGAWAIQLAPWLRPDLAVRAVYALLLWGTFSATWYAVYYLARTARAQPVAFAFGGEAQPKDYARAIADGGLLALIACLGLAQLGHETTPALAQLFFGALVFYGMAALPYHRAGPTVALLLGGLGLSLSGAPWLALILGLGSLLLGLSERWLSRPVAYADPADQGYDRIALAAMATPLMLGAGLAFGLQQFHWRVEWPGQGASSLGAEIGSLLRLFLWFTWPAWPMAMWTLWRWRRQWLARHVALPLFFVAVIGVAAVLAQTSDRVLLLALPALCTLAAFALPTFRRSVSALIDWFTLLFFSGCALFIWVYWISLQTGVPAKPAANVFRLAPGFVPEFSAFALVLALLGTLAWCWLVRWRTGRHRAALWKTLVLPAGGAALCWLLLMTLWLPLLDYARSYAPQVRAIQAQTGSAGCVAELGLSRPHIAALHYHGRYALQPINSHTECGWLLVNPESLYSLHRIVPLDQWHFVGTFRRPTSPSDDLLLFQHKPVRPAP
ncbi:MAG: hypothetical protein EOO29_11340 [Comamonadaceae bacterium]|nr:MAG: hypothetical protein EOO29_11340 [Comamonadaceae bacterium]